MLFITGCERRNLTPRSCTHDSLTSHFSETCQTQPHLTSLSEPKASSEQPVTSSSLPTWCQCRLVGCRCLFHGHAARSKEPDLPNKFTDVNRRASPFVPSPALASSLPNLESYRSVSLRGNHNAEQRLPRPSIAHGAFTDSEHSKRSKHKLVCRGI